MVCQLRRKEVKTCIVIVLLCMVPLLFISGCLEHGHKDVTFDIWLLKADARGNMQWTATIDSDPNGRGQSVIQIDNGGYAIAGTGTGPVPRILTLDSEGKVVSDMTLGTSPDYGSSLVERMNSGFVVASYSGILYQVNDNGSVLWSISLGGGSDWWKVVSAPGGGYTAAGDASIIWLGENGEISRKADLGPGQHVNEIVPVSPDGFLVGGTSDAGIWTAMLGPGGSMLWNRTFATGSPAELYTLRLSPSGTIDGIYSVTWYSGNETNEKWCTETTEISLASDGRLVGERPVNVSRVMAGTDDGGYAYAGFSVPGFTELQRTGYPGSPLHIVRLDETLSVAWDVSFDIGDHTSIDSITQTSDGGFVILGHVLDL